MSKDNSLPTNSNPRTVARTATLQDLGLATDVFRLHRNIRDLIAHGDRDEHFSRLEDEVAVCVAMFGADYCVDQIWTVMTTPENGISKRFFERDGKEAEDHLERVISKAWEKPTGKASIND